MNRKFSILLLALLMVMIFTPIVLASDFSITEMRDNAIGFIAFIIIFAAGVVAIRQFISGQIVGGVISILAAAFVVAILNFDTLKGLGQSLFNFLIGGN